jgi:hypothetical protein
MSTGHSAYAADVAQGAQLEADVKKKLAVVVSALSAVYLFVPEPTDVIPILGWMDEGVALAVLMWGLKTLKVSPDAVLGRRAVTQQVARAG